MSFSLLELTCNSWNHTIFTINFIPMEFIRFGPNEIIFNQWSPYIQDLKKTKIFLCTWNNPISIIPILENLLAICQKQTKTSFSKE